MVLKNIYYTIVHMSRVAAPDLPRNEFHVDKLNRQAAAVQCLA